MPPSGDVKPVRVFLSYAWEDDAYRERIKRFAVRLREDGIEARLDAWHASDGLTIPEFMSREARAADKVLVLCSPAYRRKVHAMENGEAISGVGWEHLLLTSTIWAGVTDRKKIAVVLFQGDWREAAPDFLLANPWLDLRDEHAASFEPNYLQLLRVLTGRTEQPPEMGRLPNLDITPVTPLRGRSAGSQPEIFCDRHKASLEFQGSVQRAFAAPAFGPTVCVTYGEASHRPGSLIDRLILELNAHRQTTLSPKAVPWDHNDAHQIRLQLARFLLNDATRAPAPADFARELARLHSGPFVLIRHSLANWLPQSAATLRQYLEFWCQWPAGPAPVFVFISIVQPTRRDWRFRQLPDPRVPLELAALTFPANAVVSGDLALVTREDLEHLIDQYDLANLGSDREDLIQCVLGGRSAVPMDQVERQIKHFRQNRKL